MPSRHSTCPWKGGDGNADGQSSELWSEQPTRRSFIYCIPLHCTVDGVAALVLAHLCRSTQRDRQANQDEQDDRQPTGGEMLQSVVHFVKHECRRGLLSPCQFGTERKIPHSYTGLLFNAWTCILFYVSMRMERMLRSVLEHQTIPCLSNDSHYK